MQNGLDPGELVCGFPGTYPTLIGSVVVKLFGYFGDWRRSYRTELMANRTIAGHPTIRAPRLLATGQLFDEADAGWPYLILERLPGTAWRDAQLTPDQRRQVAHEVGRLLAALHGLPAPDAALLQPDPVEDRSTCTDRHRRWGSLPSRLLDQVGDFLADYRAPVRALVHADVTEDHVFVDRGVLTGIIDWGDATVTDPGYELGALHLGTFAGDRSLLAAFLEGYGRSMADDLPRHALRTALLHRFDLFAGFPDVVRASRDLDELADRLFGPEDPAAARRHR